MSVEMTSVDIAVLQAHLHELYQQYWCDTDTEMINGIFNPNNKKTRDLYEEQCCEIDEEWEDTGVVSVELWPPEEERNRLYVQCLGSWFWNSVEHIHYAIIPELDPNATQGTAAICGEDE